MPATWIAMINVAAARVLVAILFASASAQAQRPRVLSAVEWEARSEFTKVRDVRTLAGGRLLVLDVGDKAVFALDARGETRTQVGRQGSGPGEYRLPLRLLALPADTSAVFDPNNARYLLIGPAQSPTGTFSLAAAPATGLVGGVDMRTPKGADAAGNIYFEAQRPRERGSLMPVQADSVAIVRRARASSREDTVAIIFVGMPKARLAGRRGRATFTSIRANPFAPRDEWVVLPDGHVMIVRASDYHVEIHAARGRDTRLPPVGFARVPVTDADRRTWKAATAREDGVSVRGPNGEVVNATGPGGFPEPDLDDWPAFKPPFLAGHVWGTPNGGAWVERTRAANDPRPVYDVFNASGVRTEVVSAPPNTRLVAFGPGTVYLVRTDDSDVEHLIRFRLLPR